MMKIKLLSLECMWCINNQYQQYNTRT
jgi:hypothetical protein